MKSKIALTFFFIFFVAFANRPAVLGQEPQLIADLNNLVLDDSSSNPENFVHFNGQTLFGANNGLPGIWSTDLTDNGTQLVVEGVQFSQSTHLNGQLIFGDLFITDGTRQGTQLLADLPTIKNYLNINNRVVCVTNEGLWTTDGTAAGTVLLNDLEGYVSLGLHDEMAYLARSNTEGIWEFWSTDGTLSGTNFLTEISCAYPSFIASLPGRILIEQNNELWAITSDFSQVDVLHTEMIQGNTNFAALNNRIVFSALSEANGIEPWVTDGTPANTFQLADLASGSQSSSPQQFFGLNGFAFFMARTGAGNSLFRTDGTELGTISIFDFSHFVQWSNLVAQTESHAYLTYSWAAGPGLMVTDGSESGTLVLKQFPESCSLTDLNNFEPSNLGCFFSVQTNELWFTNRTAEGTGRLKIIHPDFNHNAIDNFHIVNGHSLLFRGYNPDTGFELWTSDGTTDGTRLLKNITPPRNQDLLSVDQISLHGGLYIHSDGPHPVIQTYGTPETSQQFGDLTRLKSIARAKDRLIFQGTDWNYQHVVFSLDPVSNTYIQLFPNLENINYVELHGNQFGAYVILDSYLWTEPLRYFTDGTEEGTMLVGAGALTDNAVLFGKNFVFSWGTSLRTSGVEGQAQLTPWIGDLQVYDPFFNLGDHLFFHASESLTGREPWVTDGTPLGTRMVADIQQGPGSSECQLFTKWNDQFLFVNGEKELWITNLISGSTEMITNIDRSPVDRRIMQIHSGQTMFFLFVENAIGESELWVSEGSETSTYKIADLQDPREALIVGNRLFFQNTTASHGSELWSSDGTIAGTSLHTDLEPGLHSSSPRNLTSVGSQLFFLAKTTTFGEEWWRLCAEPNFQISVPSVVCAGQGSIEAFGPEFGPNATFQWFLDNGTIHSGQGTRRITFTAGNQGFATLNLTVNEFESCTNQASQIIQVVGESPGQLGAISGPSQICAFQQNVVFSVSPEPTASSYHWTLPVGAIVQSGQDSNEISVDFGQEPGLIQVQAVNTCGLGPSSELNISFIGSSAIADAGPDQETCDTQTNMNGNTWPGINGTWLILSGIGGTLIDQSDPNSALIGIPGQVYHMRWTLDLSPCPPSFDDVYVHFALPVSDAEAGEDIQVCGNSAQIAAILPTVGVGFWTCDDPQLYIANPSQSSTYIEASTMGTYTLRWSISNGICDTNWDELTATFSQPPSLIQPMPNLFFHDGTSSAMMGQHVETGQLSWSIESGPNLSIAQFDNPEDPQTLFTPAGGPGYYECVLTNNSGACEPNHQTSWAKSGTVFDTPVQLSDYSNDSSNSLIGQSFVLGNSVWFFDEAGLWRTEGSSDSLELVKSHFRGSYEGMYLGDLYFFAVSGHIDGQPTGAELAVSDGTSQGTFIIDLFPGIEGSYPQNFVALNDNLYFKINNGHGEELWRSDGTREGTQLVKKVASTNAGRILHLFSTGNRLYFNANDDVHGHELWISDGTPNSTYMLKDINDQGSSNPKSFHQLNGIVYFNAYTLNEGNELWRSDGSESGTWLVADIFPGTSWGNPSDFFGFSDHLFFLAMDQTSQIRLWRSDGTSTGTEVFFEDGTNGEMFSFGPEWFFFVSDNSGVSPKPLVYSDGTIQGTTVLPEVNLLSSPELSPDGEHALFVGNINNTRGLCQIRVTGGEPFTEVLVPNQQFTNLSSFNTVGENSFLAIEDQEIGIELWKTDGTAHGSNLLVDLRPTIGHSSNPHEFHTFAGNLFFFANQATGIEERWRICSEPTINLSVPNNLCFNEHEMTLTIDELGFGKSCSWEIVGAEVLSSLNEPTIQILRHGLTEIQANVTVTALGGCFTTEEFLIPISAVNPSRWQEPSLYTLEADLDVNGIINIKDYLLLLSQCQP